MCKSTKLPCLAYLGFLLGAPLGLCAQAIDSSAAPEIVAVVNGEPVSVERVARTLSRSHQALQAGEGASANLDRLLFKVINDVLIAQEARAMGLDEEPKVVAKVAGYRQRLAKRKLEVEEIGARAEPLDREVDAYFKSRYRRVTFRVITVDDRDLAATLLQEIERGADMAELAEQQSIDPYRLRGGLVKDIEHVDLQLDVADLLFTLEPGEASGPIQTDLGYSIVRAESFSPPSEGRFDQVEGEVRSIVRLEKAQVARRELASRLRASFRVEVHQEVAEAIQPERLPDGRLVPTLEDSEAVVVSIDGEPAILAADFGKSLIDRWDGIRNLDAARAAAPLVLNRLTEDALIEREAQRRDYGQLPEIERAVEAFEADLLVNMYLEEVVGPRIEVRPEEMRAYYEVHRQEMHRPPRIRLGQVTVATREAADQVAADLASGADLAWVARRRSIDGFKESNGDRGWYVPKPGVGGFDAQLFGAEVGTVLGPFGEPDAWVILKVLARQEQGIYSYEEVAGNVRNKVYERKSLEEIEGLIETLRNRSEIQVLIETLDQLRITGAQIEGSETGDGFGHRQ